MPSKKSRPDKPALRDTIRRELGTIVAEINRALSGKKLAALEPVLKRVGRGGEVPHWFQNLKSKGVLPNLDGKTIGSVIEMLMVAVLETSTFRDLDLPPLRINPARGVDLPDLDLGVKSPSENFCTSEPFFSAYARLLGTECDLAVLLTDYQTAKSKPPLRLRIKDWRYLTASQVADRSLCRIARAHRVWLLAENEAWARKVFRFLAYINQSDWRARSLLQLVECMQDKDSVTSRLSAIVEDFESKNRLAIRKDKPLIPDSDLSAIRNIAAVSPLHLGVIDAADNWVIEVLKDAARAPSENEWQRLCQAPLDGMIGMSFALQWRYNFSQLFGAKGCELDPELP